MKKQFITSIALVVAMTAVLFSNEQSSASDTRSIDESASPKYSLVIHGGAGTITRDRLDAETEASIRAKLTEALEAGQTILAGGGTSLDAIQASIMVMENSAHFNAGHGAVFTAQGRNEMDAAIMDGSDLNAGAITGVTRVKNPITLARAVMEKSRHVMFSGTGAEEFADNIGVEMVDPSYFYTERRWKSLQNFLESQKKQDTASIYEENPEFKFGTVGAVAIDQHGNIAAGTSTGGMTGKMFGRVGDVPIIGAGTYANNKSCGVSATGHGEFFIRATVAHSICALMEYGGLSLAEAANKIVMEQLVEMKGSGGIIAVDKDGNTALVFNSKGMYRGSVTNSEPLTTGIFDDE